MGGPLGGWRAVGEQLSRSCGGSPFLTHDLSEDTLVLWGSRLISVIICLLTLLAIGTAS